VGFSLGVRRRFPAPQLCVRFLKMRKQYHFRKTEQGMLIWDVHRLVELSSIFPVVEVPLEDIKEIDENYWYGNDGNIPTCRSIAGHIKLINETDLKHPIILCRDGRVMDGMHRVLKAFIKGHKSIKAVKFNVNPDPDYIDVDENDLPYD
jgi:hypothetical protein